MSNNLSHARAPAPQCHMKMEGKRGGREGRRNKREEKEKGGGTGGGEGSRVRGARRRGSGDEGGGVKGIPCALSSSSASRPTTICARVASTLGLGFRVRV